MVPALVGIVLAYYRDPLAYPHLGDVNTPLPVGFAALLAELGAALTAGEEEQTARREGIGVTELLTATRFFVRYVLLARDADYYRRLGLTPGASEAAIRRHYALLIRLFHPDHHAQLPAVEAGVAARLNEAYQQLRHPALRAAYDATLSPVPVRPTPATYFARRNVRAWRPSRRRTRARARPWGWAWLLLGLTALGALLYSHAGTLPLLWSGDAARPASVDGRFPTPAPAAAPPPVGRP